LSTRAFGKYAEVDVGRKQASASTQHHEASHHCHRAGGSLVHGEGGLLLGTRGWVGSSREDPCKCSPPHLAGRKPAKKQTSAPATQPSPATTAGSGHPAQWQDKTNSSRGKRFCGHGWSGSTPLPPSRPPDPRAERDGTGGRAITPAPTSSCKSYPPHLCPPVLTWVASSAGSRPAAVQAALSVRS